MNLYLTAVVIRRFAAVGIAMGAVFFGHHMVNQTQADVNQNIEAAQKSVERSNPGTVKTTKSGELKVKGANGTTVTVKGLPTTGQ